MEKLTQTELNEILDQHKLWLDTDEKETKRANFTSMDVSELDFSGRDLSWAIFLEADCEGANFSKAYCYGTNFTEADCWEANFSEANCVRANFSGTACRRTNFTKTKLSNCIGNNREIHSLRLKPYTVTIHEDIMAIGCEQHTIEDWFSFDDERIGMMDYEALEWWKENKEFVKMYIESIVNITEESNN